MRRFDPLWTAVALGVILTPASHGPALYAATARAMLAHLGRDWPVAYPPLAGFLFLLALGGPWVWGTAMGGAALVAGERILRLSEPAAARRWGWGLLAGGVVTLGGRYDIVPALALVLSLSAADGGRWAGAWGWSALAAALKGFGAVAWPIWLVAEHRQTGRWRWDRAAVAFAATLTPWGLAWLGAGGRAWSSLGWFMHRPLEFESVGASLLTLAGVPSRFTFSFGSLNVVAAPGATLAVRVTLIAGGAVLGALVLLGVARGRIALTLALATALTGILAVTGVFSPQYLLWVLPLWALTLTDRVAQGLAGAVAVLTTLTYPVLWDIGFRWAEWGAVARNAVLLALLVGLAARVWRALGTRNPTPARTPASPRTVG